METQENNDILLIENYLDSKLSEQEKEQFLLRIKSDKELEKFYRFRLKIRDDWEKAHNYDATRQLIRGVVLREKNQQRRTVIYAVAATLGLLIVVSGIITMVNRNETGQLAATKTDTTAIETYDPQINQPKSYADSGEYVTPELTLALTINADSLVFNWQPQLKAETWLVIVSLEGEKELFRKQIQPESQKISLPRNQIPSEKFIWYIEGFTARDSFELAKSK